jgi:hypothetical protein
MVQSTSSDSARNTAPKTASLNFIEGREPPLVAGRPA